MVLRPLVCYSRSGWSVLYRGAGLPSWVGCAMLVGAALSVAACSMNGTGRPGGLHSAQSSMDSAGRSSPTPTSPIPLKTLPDWALTACSELAHGSRICPQIMPLAGRQWTMLVQPASKLTSGVMRFDLTAGYRVGGDDQRLNQPPQVSEVTVIRGRSLRTQPGLLPPPIAADRTLRNGMTIRHRSTSLPLGERRWGTLEGHLFVTPSTGRYANLLMFEWRDGSADTAVGIALFEPVTSATAVLEATVSKLDRLEFDAQPSSATASVAGVAMVRSPPWLSDLCSGSFTAAACPSIIPAAMSGAAAYVTFSEDTFEQAGKVNHRARDIAVVWGGESNDVRQNRPPRLVHLDILGGIGLAPFPKPVAASQPRDGLLPQRKVPLDLGRPQWRATGHLILGGCFENHLCYRWATAGKEYQIDLHAWEPLTETVAVLRAMVQSAGH
jgi:hypothetical protein